jgi:hypothetical protein
MSIDSPFQLRMGRSPRIIPPLVNVDENKLEDIRALDVIERLEADTNEAKDNLTMAKISQTLNANQFRTDNYPLNVGDRVLLSTFNRRREQGGVQKFFKTTPLGTN